MVNQANTHNSKWYKNLCLEIFDRSLKRLVLTFVFGRTDGDLVADQLKERHPEQVFDLSLWRSDI